MAKPLSFGVEFEFLVAYIDPPLGQLPDPDEPRKVHFPPAEPEYWNLITRIQQDIADTIIAAGFPARLDNPREWDEQSETPPEIWVVKDDATIRQHAKKEGEVQKYAYATVEVVSPAYWFSASSVRAVVKVLDALVSQFLLSVNESTGFHVHVGCGTDGFPLQDLKNLVAVLWGFEHQFASLHPPERLRADEWCQSMRKQSDYTRVTSKARNGRQPGPHEGVMYFVQMTDLYKLISATSCNGRYGAYSLTNLYADGMQTVEFRGHEGCLDSARVKNWILTTVGVVDWVRKAPTMELHFLFSMVKAETWEKLGDGKDGERESQLGPISAEDRFTIIDLLKFMKLFEPALFYTNKTYKHQAKEYIEYDSKLISMNNQSLNDNPPNEGPRVLRVVNGDPDS